VLPISCHAYANEHPCKARMCFRVVVDFFDVVMHIMMPEARQFYKLEKLWGDAQFKTIDDSGNPKTFNTKDLKY